MAAAAVAVIDVDNDDDEVATDTIFTELVNVLPGVDPDHLQLKAAEFVARPGDMNPWVLAALETNCEGLPTREDYDKRVQV